MEQNDISTNFILDYIRLNEGTEIPDMFAMWCGITGVSIALGRNVYVQYGRFQIFLNLYTILVAGSGQKKSTSIVEVLRPIIECLEPAPHIISESVTPQALIKSLKVVTMDEAKRVVSERCEGWVIADEFSTFLNKTVYDSGLGPLLTAFYDCKKYSYETLARGKEHLENIYLGIMGASTADWLASAIPAAAIGGGVTSRMIFVYCPVRSKPVPRPRMSEEQRVIHERVVRTLRKIALLKGEVKVSDDAAVFYDKEYCRFYNDSPFNNDKTLAGYAQRRGNHLMKVAALLAIAQRQELLIIESDMQAAKRVLESAEQYMPLVLGLISSTTVGLMLAKVYEIIKQGTKKDIEGVITGGVAKSSLLAHFSHQMVARELSEILDTLTQSKRVECRATGNGVVYYAV